jgi:hypothetical protein
MRKSYFLVIDTETTCDGLVADFAAAIVDRRGAVFAHCAVLVHGIYTDRDAHPLYHSTNEDGSIFAPSKLDDRYQAYERMHESGARMLAGVNAINNWLGKAAARYAPILTAYNLGFDLGKCSNTGIDLTMFPKRFCMWQAAQTAFAKTKAYKRFILANHGFCDRTKYGNMTYRTNAEYMARFCTGGDLEDEPHTALEDIMFYEIPILLRLCRSKSNRWLLSEPRAHTWREFQMRDNFKPS